MQPSDIPRPGMPPITQDDGSVSSGGGGGITAGLPNGMRPFTPRRMGPGAVAYRAKGGPVKAGKPYVVNDGDGDEAFQPKGGVPQIMGGPKQVRTFPQDGKVIAHGKLMQVRKKMAKGKGKGMKKAAMC